MRIEDPTWRADALQAMALAYAQMGDTATAVTHLRQSVQAAALIDGVRRQTEILTRLAPAIAQIGDLKSLQEAVQAAAEMEDAHLKSENLRDLAQAAVHLDDQPLIGKIAALIPTINGREYQAEVRQVLVCAHLTSGDYRKAYHLARRMPEKNAKLKALAYLNLWKAWREEAGFEPVYIGDWY